jgi:hypothetical protein
MSIAIHHKELRLQGMRRMPRLIRVAPVGFDEIWNRLLGKDT